MLASISIATGGSSTSNSIARQQLDTQKSTVAQLEAQVKLDQAAIDNAKAILDYTTITAPIDGRTGIRLVDEGNIVRACRRHRHRRHHAASADRGPVHAAAAAARRGQPRLRRGPAAGRRVRPGQQDRDRERRAQGGRQPGRPDHRHDQAQGRIPQRDLPALARSVRQRPAAGRHADATWWWRRPPRCSAGRTAPSSIVVEPRQQGRGASGHGRRSRTRPRR